MRTIETAIALALCAGAFVAGRATAATPQEKEMGTKAMEAAWDEMGQTGKMHEHLKPFEGEWNADCKFWMGPGEPMTMTGTSKNEFVFGGKFLKQHYEGPFQDEDFEGIGFWGYSNVDEEYQSVWLDNMSTGIAFQTLTVSDDGKTFTAEGTEKNPMTGEEEDYKDVVKIVGPDEYVFTRYMMKDGDEHKHMKIVYTR